MLEGGAASDFLRVHALGTPASYVAGGGHYYTNVTDAIVRLINATSPVKALPPNVSIRSNDRSGHALVETYLMEGGTYTTRTISEILQHHVEMQQSGPSGICVPASVRTESNESNTFFHSPYSGHYRGPLTFFAEQKSAWNPDTTHFLVRDQYGRILVNAFNGTSDVNVTIDYDSDVHGMLNGTVTTGMWAWFLHIQCPSSLLY